MTDSIEMLSPLTIAEVTGNSHSWRELCERNYIGGVWKFTREGYGFDIYDPADSTVIATVPLSTHRDIAEAEAAAVRALPIWNEYSSADRAHIVDTALEDLTNRIDEVAIVVSRDTGLPLPIARDDTLAAINTARRRLATESGASANVSGVIGQILSWSNPIQTCAETLCQDLAAGDTVIVRPSIKAPLSPVFFADALDQAGAAGGVFNLVQGTGTDAGMALTRQTGLKRLDFHGSRAAAAMVSLAPKRNGIPLHTHFRNIRTVDLEDADDLDATVEDLMTRCLCHGARPGFGGLVANVEASLLPAFSDIMRSGFGACRYDDRSGTNHTVGPYIAEKYRNEAEALAESYQTNGAVQICQTQSPDEKTYRMGWFGAARVIHDINHNILLNPDHPNGPLIVVREIR